VNAQKAEVLIVGAGVVGLAHAYIAARAGRKAVVVERHLAAQGASIANFGMLWPIGQTPGRMLDLALASRELWLEMLHEARIPHRPTGSLHIATHDDEAQVGEEFAALAPALGYKCAWLDKEAALSRSPALRADAVKGALWSETEITVDPREVLRALPLFLQERYGVAFVWGCPVHSIDGSQVLTARGLWHAERVIVCTGSDFEALYPDLFVTSGLTRCKLQMLRTNVQADGWQLGPALAGGLTFRFYPSFRICASLLALRDRIAATMPEYDRFGIHTMVSQTTPGELTLGDSHDYGLSPSPFNNEQVDRLILEHLRSFIQVPDMSIAERWYGVYAKHPEKPFVRFFPEEGVAGMTLSFGVAAETYTDTPWKERQA
jgi:FAD dependent oxidoreductase TIGR03364